MHSGGCVEMFVKKIAHSILNYLPSNISSRNQINQPALPYIRLMMSLKFELTIKDSAGGKICTGAS